MAKIARNIVTDKRAKSKVQAKVHATKIYLTYNNLEFSLSRVDAQRIADTLTKAIAIQETHKVDAKHASTPKISLQIQKPEPEPEPKPIHEKNLDFCIKVAKYLKELNPNDIFRLEKNSIVQFKPNSRLCKSSSCGAAHYHNGKPYRICIRKKVLLDGSTYTAEYANGGRIKDTCKKIKGNYGLIDLICHELAHHRTKGHGNKFYKKYCKFRLQMINAIISGVFYNG